MRGQLQHLIDISEWAQRAPVQVMPFSFGSTPASGAFTILSFPSPTCPTRSTWSS